MISFRQMRETLHSLQWALSPCHCEARVPKQSPGGKEKLCVIARSVSDEAIPTPPPDCLAPLAMTEGGGLAIIKTMGRGDVSLIIMDECKPLTTFPCAVKV